MMCRWWWVCVYRAPLPTWGSKRSTPNAPFLSFMCFCVCIMDDEWVREWMNEWMDKWMNVDDDDACVDVYLDFSDLLTQLFRCVSTHVHIINMMNTHTHTLSLIHHRYPTPPMTPIPPAFVTAAASSGPAATFMPASRLYVRNTCIWLKSQETDGRHFTACVSKVCNCVTWGAWCRRAWWWQLGATYWDEGVEETVWGNVRCEELSWGKN